MAKRKHVVESDSEEEFKASRFVDVEASEDESSDNESMDDFINEIAEDVEVAEEGGEEETAEEEGQENYASSSSEKLEDFEEYTKTVEERYKTVDAVEIEEIPQQLLLPTDKSPKLWLIRCAPGKEKQLVLSIIRKTMHSKLNIASVLANELVKGYIYIEAYQKQQVLQAIEGISGVFKSNIAQVPNKEMADVLFIPELDTVVFKKGNYLRIVKGRYAGEIGRVESIGSTKEMISMKIVPKVNGKYKLFSAKDYAESEVYKVPDGKWVYNKDMYKDGYLLKDIPVSYLSPTPTIAREERKWFDTAENKKITGALFVKNEVVEVMYGGLKGAVGKILTVGEDEAVIKIGERKVSVSLAEIKKRYSIGDEVQVISGRKRGKHGFVVGMAGSKLMIGVNNFSEEIEVDLEEVKLSAVPDTEPEKAKTQLKIAGRPKRDPLVDRQGEITAGEYKGKRGTIKDVLADTFRVQLITTLKCVSVDRKDFLIHKKNTAPPMGTETTPRQLLERMGKERKNSEEEEEDESTTMVQDGNETPEIEHTPYTPGGYKLDNLSDDE
ncbi:transcription elongation factor SPT5 [Nematocida minor]|uniref:transcription elongation factor SPT5 n=1 Tax=Nematocida minor TaxID=1912983 RepID=UPI00221ED723|nr:transcription elongation factor SPT5 [Nematocida minor]KAI5191908.1 transcription elongation factor SPT5 [Nematocida minor]